MGTNANPVLLTMGYNTESTSNSTDDFLFGLERNIIESAIRGALDCFGDANRRHLEDSKTIQDFVVNTDVLGKFMAILHPFSKSHI